MLYGAQTVGRGGAALPRRVERIVFLIDGNDGASGGGHVVLGQ